MKIMQFPEGLRYTASNGWDWYEHGGSVDIELPDDAADALEAADKKPLAQAVLKVVAGARLVTPKYLERINFGDANYMQYIDDVLRHTKPGHRVGLGVWGVRLVKQKNNT